MARKPHPNDPGEAPTIERKDFVLELPVVLTDEERLNYSREMARSTQDLQRATDRKAEATKQYAAEIERHRSNVMRLGALLDSGKEHRKVDCTMLIDRGSEFVTITRLDTGEQIEHRPLRPEERQGSLPL